MLIDKISPRNKEDVNVIIEISMNSGPVKYELDKNSGALFVDRFMQTSMFYPCNYGFVPNTLALDGDPIDVFVMSNFPIMPSSVVPVRPVAALIMKDEAGMDEKIISVPTNKVDLSFSQIQDQGDLGEDFKQKIVHFLSHYKDLENGKWVQIQDWKNKNFANQLIDEGIERLRKNI